METAIRFDEPAGLSFILAPAPLPQRIAAAKEFLMRLDAEDGIDSTAGFEFSRVSVTVTLAGDQSWVADFHVVWPEPQLNNQHLSAFRLINWTVAGLASPTSAPNAREEALTRLTEASGALTGAGGPLDGRVQLVQP